MDSKKINAFIASLIEERESAYKQKVSNLEVQLKELRKEWHEKDKQIRLLKWESFRHSSYKAFYYIHHHICPHCDWMWGFEDWHSWEPCELCETKWEAKTAVVEEYIKKQIESQRPKDIEIDDDLPF